MRLKFDDYVIDVVRRELWNGAARIPMEPQVFDLLAYLVQNPDRVVSRDELLQAIWDGRVISDSAIANRINGARRAIGDSGEAQRLIRTVPRKGFRFIGPVEEAVVARGAGRGRRAIGSFAGVALLAAVVVVLIVAWPQPQPGFRAETTAMPSVLVSTLPVKGTGAGAGDLSLPAIAADGPALRYDAPPRPAAKAVPASAKPIQDVAVAALPGTPVIPAAAEQQQKAPTPDVAVGSPAAIPRADPSSPGRPGVDEANWSVIPCANARIDLGAGATCQAGPPVPRGGHCDISRQVATVTNTRYQIEADVRIFDPYKVTATGNQGKNCAVWSGYSNLPDDFKTMNQMTRRGTGWTNFVKDGSQTTAAYVDGGRNCLAVERLGPPWHGGYVWVVHASICPAAGGAVQNADIDAVFAMLQLRTYDAQANLRAQSQ